MGLSQALATASSGLRATQSGLTLIASNVANAQTPGYVRKTLVQATTSAGEGSIGVRVSAINRELDSYLQRQFRVEMAGGGYADLRAQFYTRLQQLYGQPGAPSSLETLFNNLTDALQNLSTSPESVSARSLALSSAQVLTEQLNSMTTDIQALRSDAERGLADATAAANDAMQRIATINSQLATANLADASTAALFDERDAYIDKLATLMDIKVITGENNQVNIFTNSGVQLVGTQPTILSFNAQGTMTPAAKWDTDPSESTVGTLMLELSSGGTFDLISNRSIRSGEIAALIEMRDDVLVKAQSQLDSLAAAMAQALSDRTIAGTPVTLGAQTGFTVDVAGLLPGNTLSLTYTDNTTSTQRKITIVRVDDPAALPLTNDATADPTDEVIGINFAGGIAAAVAALNTHFNGRIVFDNPAGTTLRVLDDGLPDLSDVDAFSTTQTVTTLTGGSLELPLFLDGSNPYTGAISTLGSQRIGLAGRIAVNSGLIADPSRLVVYSLSPLTASGDPTRPDFIYQRLTEFSMTHSADTGIGTEASPFSAAVPVFLRQMLSEQGQNAANAENLSAGQAVVVNSLRERIADGSAVNVDEEMANLLTLQTAYAANARVMSTVKEMFDVLLRM